MIGLFRKMRNQLANENQFLKYSRYAIGEILLVVIGILIALQVNNWNEKRKQTNQRNYYLSAILSDMQENLAYLEQRNESINLAQEKQSSIQQRLTHPTANIDTALTIANNEIGLFYYSFAPQNMSTYETLLNTGHIEYFEPWLIESLQQINFLHNNLMSINDGMGRDYSVTVLDFLSVYPKSGDIISDHIAEVVTDELSDGKKISALHKLLWIRGGAYASLQRRSVPLEEKTRKLIDTLVAEYPFLNNNTP